MKRIRSLSRLRDKSKGSVHTVQIHPATNSKGGLGFVTTKLRHPAKGKSPGIGYAAPPAPEEAVHESQPDMVDHVGRSFGVQPEEDDEE